MAKSSIHIEAGAGGYFAHNSREQSTVNSIFSDEPNFCSCPKKVAFEIYRSELEKRSEAYTERTGQKLQKNAITHLSAIVNFNKDHTPEDMRKVCDLLERKFDTKVIQYAMHRDEGHIKEDGTPDKNYHAHIEFMGLDSRGESVRRKLDRPTLKALQNDVAKTLGMERGKDYAKERSPRPKRLDTYEYKAHKEGIEKEVKEAVLATQKDLKDEIALLRSQLKEQGATRAEHAQIEQLNKELSEQIKAKELSNDDLKKSLETVRSLRSSDQTKILELSQTVDDLKTDILEISTKYSKSEKTIEALNSELQEAKRPSAAVEVAQGDTAQLKELENLSETWATHISNPDFSKKEEIEELEKAIPTHDPKKVAIAVYNSHIVPDTGIMGKLGNEKKDTDLLITNMAKEIEKRDKLLKRAVDMLKNSEITRKRVTDSIKTVVKSTEMALKAFFSKKERDLSSAPKKELTEQLQHTLRSRAEILQDAKEISQGFFDKLNAQGKDKEPEPTKSRGMDLSR